MTPSESELLRLTLSIHDAATDPARWEEFLEQYARAIGAGIAVVQEHHFREHRSELRATFGMTWQFTDSYNQHYSRLNVWRERGRHEYVEGRVIFDEEFCPRPILKRSEFFNDYLIPNRGTQSLAGVIERRADHALMLTALRDEAKPSWTETEQGIVHLLMPHLRQAHAVQQRLQLLDAGDAVFNSVAVGLVFLGADTRIVFQNRAAEDVFRAGDGLRARDGRLEATDSRAHAALRRAIHLAVAPGQRLEASTPVLVPRPSLRRPYHLTASPIRRALPSLSGLASIAAVVFITDLEPRPTVSIATLSRLYGLTEREGQLTLELAAGHTVQEASTRLEMRYETARTHLRRIFSKTQTSRQSELTMLVQRLSNLASDAG